MNNDVYIKRAFARSHNTFRALGGYSFGDCSLSTPRALFTYKACEATKTQMPVAKIADNRPRNQNTLRVLESGSMAWKLLTLSARGTAESGSSSLTLSTTNVVKTAARIVV